MALSKDTVRDAQGRSTLSLQATAGVTFFVGSLVGVDRATGLAVLWSDTDGVIFVGLSTEKLVAVSGSRLRVDTSGDIRLRLSVAGAAAVTDVGAMVFATDDGTLTLTATTNVGAIGMVTRYYNGTICDVMIFTPEEYAAMTGAGPTLFDGDVTITGKLTVNGPIDPPSLTLTDGDDECFINLGTGSAAAVAPAGEMRLIFDEVAGVLKVSVDEGAYEELGGGGEVTFPLEAPDGLFSAPSYSFENATGSGMFLSGSNAVVSSDGEQIAIFSNDGASHYQILGRESAFNAPTFASTDDPTTGVNLSGSDVTITHDGEDVCHFINDAGDCQVRAREGTVSKPSYSVTSDSTTGINLSTNDVTVVHDGEDICHFVNVGGGIQQALFRDGDTSTPGIAFVSDQDTGLTVIAGALIAVVDGADILQVANAGAQDQGAYINGYLALNDDPGVGLSDAGTARLRYNDATGDIEVSADGGAYAALGGTSFPLEAPDGTAGAPSYSFSASPDTGIYSSGVGEVAISAGGFQLMRAGPFGNVAITTDAGLIWENQTSAGAAQTGTLTNAPAAGNPAFWLRIAIDGANYAIPCWEL